LGKLYTPVEPVELHIPLTLNLVRQLSLLLPVAAGEVRQGPLVPVLPAERLTLGLIVLLILVAEAAGALRWERVRPLVLLQHQLQAGTVVPVREAVEEQGELR
jgi:hypothetical protein